MESGSYAVWELLQASDEGIAPESPANEPAPVGVFGGLILFGFAGVPNTSPMTRERSGPKNVLSLGGALVILAPHNQIIVSGRRVPAGNRDVLHRAHQLKRT